MKTKPAQLDLNHPDIWNRIICKTHGGLFDVEYLHHMGAIYRRQFTGEAFPGDVVIPSIQAKHCRFPQADLVCGGRSGFDLPLLFTSKHGFNNKLVVFASQDPLRGKGWPTTLTMSTPWGFSTPKVTSRGGKILWPVVEWLCREGYGVYLTDVWKLWPSFSPPISGNVEIIRLQETTFEKEVDELGAEVWIALGQKSQKALRKKSVPNVLPLTHPTARAEHLMTGYGIQDASFDNIRSAMKQKIKTELGI